MPASGTLKRKGLERGPVKAQSPSWRESYKGGEGRSRRAEVGSPSWGEERESKDRRGGVKGKIKEMSDQ